MSKGSKRQKKAKNTPPKRVTGSHKEDEDWLEVLEPVRSVIPRPSQSDDSIDSKPKISSARVEDWDDEPAAGTWLRNARETQGISIKALAQQTHIRHNIITAIELMDVATLPDEVFLFGFLRKLAKALSIDSTELELRYRRSLGRLSIPSSE